VNVSVATSPVYKITVTPLTPNAVTPITVTVSSGQNVAVTVNPNVLGPAVDPRLPAPGAIGNVCTSDGSNWTSATPSVAWGNVTGTLSNQTDLATALAAKEPSIAPGTTSQYWRGDKTWQPINWLTSETDPVFTAWKAATPPLYAESDTLASVTARGAATSVASSFTGGLSASTVSAGSLNVQTPTTSTVGAIMEGASGQTADLQQWQASTGAVVARVTKDGYLGTHGASATSTSGWTIFEGTPGNYDQFLNFALDGATKIRFAPDGTLALPSLSVAGDTFTYNLRAQNDHVAIWGDGIGISSPSMTMKWASVKSPWYSATFNVSLSETSAGVLQVGDGGVNANGTITAKSFRLRAYTVATLPAGTQGDTAYVTDAVAPTYLGTLTGGGTVVTPVFYNGSAWVSY
jgi:hypothetical protein